MVHWAPCSVLIAPEVCCPTGKTATSGKVKGRYFCRTIPHLPIYPAKRRFSLVGRCWSRTSDPPCKGGKARCRVSHGIAVFPYLSRFLFPGLPCIAPYCAPGGVKVVSKGVKTSCGAGAPAWPWPSCCPRSCRSTTASKPCCKIPCRCECGTCRARPRHGDTQDLIAHPLAGRQHGVLLPYSQPRRLKTR